MQPTEPDERESGARPTGATTAEADSRGGAPIGDGEDSAGRTGESEDSVGRPGDGVPTTGDEAAVPPAGETVTLAERETRRWYGVGTLSLLALGVGVITGTAPPLLAGIFGLAFAGYAELTAPPALDLAVERTIDATEPDPGDAVTVTVSVTNEGRRPLLDLRLVDGVPARLGVTDGSPRHGAVLLPGASTTFTYTLRATPGEHRFDRLAVVGRDASGANERVATVGDRSVVRCTAAFPTDPPAMPLRSKVSQFTGRFPGDTGGPGLEFHATRQYRRGDPLSRVDWRRTARTGELTTVEFRVERTVRVGLVFDTRREAHRAPTPQDPSAVERSIEAGITAYASLTGEGHDVGIAAIAPADCWLGPGSGDRHRTAARHVFTTSPALSTLPPEEETNIYETTQRLKGRLSADAQVMLFSPLTDDQILDTAVRLDAHGYAVTVVAPDPTTDETTGQVYARVQRRLRIADLRSRAIPVVDWNGDEAFGQAIARATHRWSK